MGNLVNRALPRYGDRIVVSHFVKVDNRFPLGNEGSFVHVVLRTTDNSNGQPQYAPDYQVQCTGPTGEGVWVSVNEDDWRFV